jgi:hypothetical protein
VVKVDIEAPGVVVFGHGGGGGGGAVGSSPNPLPEISVHYKANGDLSPWYDTAEGKAVLEKENNKLKKVMDPVTGDLYVPDGQAMNYPPEETLWFNNVNNELVKVKNAIGEYAAPLKPHTLGGNPANPIYVKLDPVDLASLADLSVIKKMVKAIICGGDKYKDKKTFEAVMDTIGICLGNTACAQGGTTTQMATHWAYNKKIPCNIFDVDPDHGKVLGITKRNQAMLDVFKPDVVIAFPGALDMHDLILRALKSSIQVIAISGVGAGHIITGSADYHHLS